MRSGEGAISNQIINEVKILSNLFIKPSARRSSANDAHHPNVNTREAFSTEGGGESEFLALPSLLSTQGSSPAFPCEQFASGAIINFFAVSVLFRPQRTFCDACSL